MFQKGHTYLYEWSVHKHRDKKNVRKKDYRNLDSLFPFVAALLDRATGVLRNTAMTTVHSRYSMLLKMFMNRYECSGFRAETFAELKRKIAELISVIMNTLEEYRDAWLFTLKFHLLDHLAENLERFGSPEMLDSSPFEH